MACTWLPFNKFWSTGVLCEPPFLLDQRIRRAHAQTNAFVYYILSKFKLNEKNKVKLKFEEIKKSNDIKSLKINLKKKFNSN